jgi:hypothetical protein
MFLAAGHGWRRDSYFTTWLKYRTALIYRLSSDDFDGKPMPNAVWRNFLTQESLQKASSSSKGTKLRELAQDFLQNCLNVDGVHFKEPSCDELQWNGRVVETLTDLEREEIVWELCELNFRFELLALDSRATTIPESKRQTLVSECFPGNSLLVADLGSANHGLASHSWEERALYLHAMKRLMMTWRGKVPPIITAEKVRWTMHDIEDLEREITKFYVASFYNHFRRAPVAPRGLSHQAASYVPPPPPPITVVNPRPKVFYDVSLVI